MGKQTRGRQNAKQSVRTVMAFAVAAVAVLVAISLFSSRDRQPAAHALSDAELGAVRNVKGRADASVTVVVFTDYL